MSIKKLLALAGAAAFVAVAGPAQADIKIGVVPFSMTVNVGTSYQNASWMKGVQPTSYGSDIFANTTTNRFTMLNQVGMSWRGCVESRPAPYDVQDTAPNAGDNNTYFVPYFAPDEPVG